MGLEEYVTSLTDCHQQVTRKTARSLKKHCLDIVSMSNLQLFCKYGQCLAVEQVTLRRAEERMSTIAICLLYLIVYTVHWYVQHFQQYSKIRVTPSLNTNGSQMCQNYIPCYSIGPGKEVKWKYFWLRKIDARTVRIAKPIFAYTAFLGASWQRLTFILNDQLCAN